MTTMMKRERERLAISIREEREEKIDRDGWTWGSGGAEEKAKEGRRDPEKGNACDYFQSPKRNAREGEGEGEGGREGEQVMREAIDSKEEGVWA